jgi:PqqD family protein of HPr-rel-A system
MSRKWRILGPDFLTWHCWDGEYVVYNGVSGMTHYLDPVAGVVFALGLEGPATADELVTRFAVALKADVTDDLRSAVGQTLARLDELGLAEAVA